jgi:hypothetical protein
MSKKSLPILFPMVVLLFASLACNALSGGAASGFQATANAAFTQAAAGAATAGVQGSSAEATANAALTQAVGQGSSLEATANAAATEANATANAVTGGTDATATPAGDQPTAEATTAGGGTTADGGPADIPLVNAANTVLLASAQLVSYQTTADAARRSSGVIISQLVAELTEKHLGRSMRFASTARGVFFRGITIEPTGL